METVIEIQHLKKHFGSLEVLNDINFSVQKGEVVTVIGSSGSGKSTMLRCINMLETPSVEAISSFMGKIFPPKAQMSISTVPG